MPLEPSVTSASPGPWPCTLRYLSAVLPQTLERPGPKSVSAATNCSGVDFVVSLKWIVDMACSLLEGDLVRGGKLSGSQSTWRAHDDHTRSRHQEDDQYPVTP